MKSERKQARREALAKRLKIKNVYFEYFYNLFMNNFIIEGIEDKEADFILTSYWEAGKVSGFNMNIASVKVPAFARFTENMYDMYNWPIKAQPIAVSSDWRMPKYFPKTPLEVDKNIVISYAQKSRTPIKDFVLYYVNRIVQIEMLTDTSINSLKMPFLVAVRPEDKQRLEEIIDRILNDEEIIYLDAEDITNIKVLLTQSPYILDKLFQQKQGYVNEVLTRLGINNVDIEKKEHLIVDEANANNQLISDNGDIFLNSIEKFCEDCGKILGIKMSVTSKNKLKQEEMKNKQSMEEEEDEEDDNN